MWFAMFQGEQNMAELIHRLFQIRGPQAEALAREAETAITAYLPCPFWRKANNFQELFAFLLYYVATIK